MTTSSSTPTSPPSAPIQLADVATIPLPRIKSGELFQNTREIEIDHNGRIYKMRVTHLNKLILTA